MNRKTGNNAISFNPILQVGDHKGARSNMIFEDFLTIKFTKILKNHSISGRYIFPDLKDGAKYCVTNSL